MVMISWTFQLPNNSGRFVCVLHYFVEFCGRLLFFLRAFGPNLRLFCRLR